MQKRFISFYRRYHAPVLATARARLIDVERAEELTAESFQLAWQKRDEGNTFELKWVYMTLRHLIGNEYRKQSFRVPDAALSDGQLFSPDHSDTVSDTLTTRTAVAYLPEAARELIWMHYWEQLTFKEIAQILECRVGTVRVRMHRAKQQLRTILEEGSHRNMPVHAKTDSNSTPLLESKG